MQELIAIVSIIRCLKSGKIGTKLPLGTETLRTEGSLLYKIFHFKMEGMIALGTTFKYRVLP